MDIIHKSSHYIAKQSSTQTAIGQSNSFGDSRNMDHTAMVPHAPGNVDQLSSYAPLSKKTLFVSFNQEAVHPLWKHLALAVWSLTEYECKQQAFHKRYVMSS